jgi:hypothetical protein
MLEDFRYNAEERYGTIVLNKGFVTILENWYDVNQFPFFWKRATIEGSIE